MTQSFRALFFVALLFFAIGAMATDVTVDCNASQTINGALTGLDNQGPHNIFVSGNCVENVVIFQRERISILAAPGTTLTPANPNSRVLVINDSHAIAVDSLTITGGRGVVVAQSSTATLTNLDISHSSFQGININEGSRVQASVLHVHDNTRQGIAVSGNSSLLIDTSTVEGNGGSGFSLNVGRLVIFGGDGTPGSESYIRNNHNAGIGASTSYVEVDDDVRIQNNGSNGVIALHTSSLFMGGIGLIEGNGLNGIYLGETSHGEIDTVTIRNNGNASPGTVAGFRIVDNADGYLDGNVQITGNNGYGVLVDDAALFSSLGGNTINSNAGDGVFIHANGTGHWVATDTITGNNGPSIECDNTSLVTGDITGVNNVKCSRVEKVNSGNAHNGTPTRGGLIP
jgi:hypothetical protein